jgi:F-type H+-transporting ATPase subunit gamma
MLQLPAELMHLFVINPKNLDKIVVVYNQFVNAATQDVKTEQFLANVVNTTVEEGTSSAGDYIFEPI